jgi:hypothetical protein
VEKENFNNCKNKLEILINSLKAKEKNCKMPEFVVEEFFFGSLVCLW